MRRASARGFASLLGQRGLAQCIGRGDEHGLPMQCLTAEVGVGREVWLDGGRRLERLDDGGALGGADPAEVQRGGRLSAWHLPGDGLGGAGQQGAVDGGVGSQRAVQARGAVLGHRHDGAARGVRDRGARGVAVDVHREGGGRHGLAQRGGKRDRVAVIGHHRQAVPSPPREE
ncbi:hypothetical protein [Demequina litorisediminis]|uniref:hypothetical protein n=1 Tax=Demequina litorisediminis TaxID=1849022 RepID=UPI0024E1856E|nr:hypothetical protein [Demequina litorisediminis]